MKGIDVKFPLNVMTVVTGVSGSGKSSLVRDIFYEGVKHYLDEAARLMVDCSGLEGDMHMIKMHRVRRPELHRQEFPFQPGDLYRSLR